MPRHTAKSATWCRTKTAVMFGLLFATAARTSHPVGHDTASASTALSIDAISVVVSTVDSDYPSRHGNRRPTSTTHRGLDRRLARRALHERPGLEGRRGRPDRAGWLPIDMARRPGPAL